MAEETNPRIIALPGYGDDYGSKEARLALAIADTGGGSSTPPGAIAQGINDATDIDIIIAELQDINTRLQQPVGAYVEKIGTVGITAVEFEPANASRTAVQIMNTSGVNLYIRFGNVATYSTAFRIKPDGVFYSQIKSQIVQSVSIISEAANSPYVGFVIQ